MRSATKSTREGNLSSRAAVPERQRLYRAGATGVRVGDDVPLGLDQLADLLPVATEVVVVDEVVGAELLAPSH